MNKALYAGSFDPLTNGHLDLIRRAAKICDTLVVGIIANPQKTPLFTIDERKQLIGEECRELENIKVESFSGLLADYVNDNDFNMVVRGLRGGGDFEYEIAMAQMNARLYKEKVETVFLMTDPSYSFISSTIAKEVCSLGGSIEGLVPGRVLAAMKEKYNVK